MPSEIVSEGRNGSRLLIWAGALIAALWLGLTAAGAVAASDAPGAATALYPVNGFAYESRALVRAARGKAAIRDMRITPAVVADAREALRREPLAVTAMTLIAMDMEAKGKQAEAAKLMLSVRALDKRELLANAWLIAHYGRTPDHAGEVLGLLTEALRIRPQLADGYMPALAQGLANPDTIPVFYRMLRAKPEWETAFWNAVAANDASLPNAEILRGRILKAGEKPGEIDMTLMAAFVRTQRMDLALSYGKSLPEMPEDRDNLLRNSSFSSVPGMPPLDWQLTNDGRMTAAVDEGSGALVLNATAGSGGIVARQLVAIPPGRYALLAKLGRAEFSRGSELRIRVHCAEAVEGEALGFSARAEEADIDHAFAVPDTTRCRFFWVDLIFSALDATSPASMNIAEIRIVRARKQQETEAPAVVTDGQAPE